MLDFILLNSQAFLNGELIFRAFLKKFFSNKNNNVSTVILNTSLLNVILEKNSMWTQFIKIFQSNPVMIRWKLMF